MKFHLIIISSIQTSYSLLLSSVASDSNATHNTASPVLSVQPCLKKEGIEGGKKGEMGRREKREAEGGRRGGMAKTA